MQKVRSTIDPYNLMSELSNKQAQKTSTVRKDATCQCNPNKKQHYTSYHVVAGIPYMSLTTPPEIGTCCEYLSSSQHATGNPETRCQHSPNT